MVSNVSRIFFVSFHESLLFVKSSESLFYANTHYVVSRLLIPKVSLNDKLFFNHVQHSLSHNKLHPPINFLLHLFKRSSRQSKANLQGQSRFLSNNPPIISECIPLSTVIPPPPQNKTREYQIGAQDELLDSFAILSYLSDIG